MTVTVKYDIMIWTGVIKITAKFERIEISSLRKQCVNKLPKQKRDQMLLPLSLSLQPKCVPDSTNIYVLK
jgi:hypothetical protein